MNIKTIKRQPEKTRVEPFIYGKVPPQAQEIEQALLGAIMLERGAFDVVADILNPDCFYLESHKKIFLACRNLSLAGKPIDIFTVVEELNSAGNLESVGGGYGVSKLTNTVVSAANIEAHSRIVLQKFLLNELIRITGTAFTEAYEDGTDVFDLMDRLEESVGQLRMRNIGTPYRSVGDIAFKNIIQIEELKVRDVAITGVKSGFPELDNVTCGWQPGDLIILAARPSVGKTALALTLAKNARVDDKVTPIGLFSLEMKDTKLVERMLSQDSDVWLWRIMNGKVDDDQMQRLYRSANNFSNVPIFVDDSHSLSIQEFRVKARLMKRKENVGMIIVDYLQLMTDETKKGNREQEISAISRGLKQCAKELNIPIIALSQLSRELEKGGGKTQREPQLSDLRESGAIEQDADMVIFLYKPSEGEIMQDSGLISTFYSKIAKHRNGALAKFIGKFVGETQTHSYLRVVNSNTLQPEGANWKPVNMPPAANNWYEKDKSDYESF